MILTSKKMAETAAGRYAEAYKAEIDDKDSMHFAKFVVNRLNKLACPTKDVVDLIIGDDSFTRLECTVCKTAFHRVAEIGSEKVCFSCLKDAYDEFSVISLCLNCNTAKAVPLHTCPYKSDINDDQETLCNCCETCAGNCADEC